MLRSPYLFAWLVGLNPPLFYISNNWYMFKPTLSLFIIGIVSLTTFCLLSATYRTSSALLERALPKASEAISIRILVLTGTSAWAFLLRQTLLELVGHDLLLYGLIVVVLGGALVAFIDRIQLLRINVALLLLCLSASAAGIVSVFSIESREMESSMEPAVSPAMTDDWIFAEKRNVYYIVPDSYPNREALERVFGINNEAFYQQLESWGFRVAHSGRSQTCGRGCWPRRPRDP